MNKQRKVPCYRPLSLESLESRLPLAGEVLLKVSGGNLTVAGDDAANEISIVQQATAGVFQVIAKAGETLKLNGVPYVSGADIPGITKDIRIDLKNGNDSVDLIGLGKAGAATARNVTIHTKAGSDVAAILDANVTGSVAVDTGSGDLNTDLAAVFVANVKTAASLTLKTGKGNASVSVQDSEIGANAGIKTGAGIDDVIMAGTTVGKNLSIATGENADTVFVREGDVAGNATIRTGAGEDSVNLLALQKFGKNLAINTGHANAAGELNAKTDLVAISAGVTVAGNSSITTGDGNDNVSIDDASFHKLTLKTGKGNDILGIARNDLLPVTVDQVLVDLGAGDDDIFLGQSLLNDPINLAQLVLLGPKASVIKVDTGDDTATGTDDLTGIAFLKDPTTTGFETILNNN